MADNAYLAFLFNFIEKNSRVKGFTFWRTNDGQWQCSIAVDEINNWRIATGATLAEALNKACEKVHHG